MSWKSFILRPMTSTKSSTRRNSSLMFGPSWENKDTWNRMKEKGLWLGWIFWTVAETLETWEAFYRKAVFVANIVRPPPVVFSVSFSHLPHKINIYILCITFSLFWWWRLLVYFFFLTLETNSETYKTSSMNINNVKPVVLHRDRIIQWQRVHLYFMSCIYR